MGGLTKRIRDNCLVTKPTVVNIVWQFCFHETRLIFKQAWLETQMYKQHRAVFCVIHIHVNQLDPKANRHMKAFSPVQRGSCREL